MTDATSFGDAFFRRRLRTALRAARRLRALRPLRRALHARGPDGRPRRADRGVSEVEERPGLPRRVLDPAAHLRQPPVPAHRGQAPVRALRARAILLKREDLNHTGSHKINNVLGQALLTQRMGKRRVIAETGAGQHGVATATAAACSISNA